MKRREFVERLGIGSAALASLTGVAGGQDHEHVPLSGPLSNATVSLGQWRTDPPFDRYPNVLPAPAQNVHLLTPNMPSIKAGGAVNFVIAGLHNVQIFEPGKQPADVQSGLTVPMTGPAPFTGLPLIDDPVGRVYRGPDPSLLPLDRVEVVQLTHAGTYLVICGFLFHFQDNMFGWVKVLP